MKEPAISTKHKVFLHRSQTESKIRSVSVQIFGIYFFRSSAESLFF